jgi:hypothetical protein
MFDWLKRVFTKEQAVGDAIELYGTLLEKYPSAILDISMLPASKSKMKLLLKALYVEASDATLANAIEVAFISLSNFQDGVGSVPIDAALRGGTSKADMAADIRKMDKWLPWSKLASAESEILMAEWDRFKNGEPA